MQVCYTESLRIKITLTNCFHYRRSVTVRQAKPDFMSVTEGIKGDALKFGFFIMREFFPKLEKGQSDGYRQNN